MPANRIWSVRPDNQVSFAAHIEPSLRAHGWLTKWLALRDNGKPKQAAQAERKARHWMRKTMALEARVEFERPPARPPGQE